MHVAVKLPITCINSAGAVPFLLCCLCHMVLGVLCQVTIMCNFGNMDEAGPGVEVWLLLLE